MSFRLDDNRHNPSRFRLLTAAVLSMAIFAAAAAAADASEKGTQMMNASDNTPANFATATFAMG